MGISWYILFAAAFRTPEVTMANKDPIPTPPVAFLGGTIPEPLPDETIVFPSSFADDRERSEKNAQHLLYMSETLQFNLEGTPNMFFL